MEIAFFGMKGNTSAGGAARSFAKGAVMRRGAARGGLSDLSAWSLVQFYVLPPALSQADRARRGGRAAAGAARAQRSPPQGRGSGAGVGAIAFGRLLGCV